MPCSRFNVKPKQTQTSPFSSFFRLEPALPHTHARVTFRTLEVWLLTGFNFLNGTPHTRSIEGTYGLIQFQYSTQTDPNSTIFVIFSVRTCTAPHTRTCNFSHPGGLGARGFQLFEQEVPYPIDSRYSCPSPVSTLIQTDPNFAIFVIFPVRVSTDPTRPPM